DGIRDLIVTGVQTCALPICRVVRACSRRSVTRTIGVPGTGIFYMSRTGTQTGMHSATPPADPARDPAVEALGAVEECPFGHPRGDRKSVGEGKRAGGGGGGA